MPIAKIQMEDGRIARVEVPEGTTPEQVMAFVKSEVAKSSGRGSFIDPVAQGATLGLSDEIAGALGATVGKVLPESLGGLPAGTPWGDAYEGIRQQALGQKESFAARNPVLSPALEIGGGVATGGLGAARAAGTQAATGIPKYLRYAGAGAVPGAISGAGYADPGERLQGAGVGGAVGGTIGAVAPAVINAATGAGKQAMALMGRTGSQSQAKVAEALAHDALTPQQAQARLAQDPDMLLPDLGPNLRGLARGATSFPGPAKRQAEKVLEKRASQSGVRMKQNLYENLSRRDNVLDVVDEINAAARQRAKPLYEMAYRAPIQHSDTLQRLISRPAMASAFQKAKKIAKEEDIELPQVFKIEDDKVVDIVEIPDMRTWDYIKRGLDDVIEDHTDEFGRVRGALGNAVSKTKSELLDELDMQNPTYGQARALWTSKSRLERAARQGEKFLQDDFDMTQRMFAGLSEAEQDMFRVGAMKALRTQINKMGDMFDVGKRLLGKQDTRDKLRMVFPNDQAFRAFAARSLREQKMARTKADVLGGSPTARIEAEKASMLMDPTFVGQAARMDIPGALGAAGRYLSNRMQVPTEKMGREISGMMFDQGQQRLLMQRLMQEDPQAALRLQKMNMGLLGGLMGGGVPAVQ